MPFLVFETELGQSFDDAYSVQDLHASKNRSHHEMDLTVGGVLDVLDANGNLLGDWSEVENEASIGRLAATGGGQAAFLNFLHRLRRVQSNRRYSTLDPATMRTFKSAPVRGS